MYMKFIVVLICQIISCLYCYSQQRILFIGNSLSYSNDLPGLVADIGNLSDLKLEVKCICFPNYGLEDHLKAGTAKTEILEGNYDFVLFQQGPSSQNDGRVSLIQYGDSLATWTKTADSKPYYLMIWTSLSRANTWPSVIVNYKDAAIENKAGLIAVGAAWKNYLDFHEDAELYAPDGFHPSLLGSQFAAIYIYQQLFETPDFHGLSRHWKLSKVHVDKVQAIIKD